MPIDSIPAPFPVSGSILSAHTLLTTVLPAYDIGRPTACTLWSHGVNDVYRVEAAGARYMFKVYRAAWRSRPEVLYELDALAHLARQGVAVALPIPTREGASAVALQAPEGERQAVLYEHAPGRPFTWPFYEDVGECRLFGTALAAIHDASADFASPHTRPPLDLDYLLEQPLRGVAPFLADRPADVAYLQGLAGRLRARLDAAVTEALEWGLCHGDAQCGNAFLADGHAAVFFDFDACGPGWRAYDLASFRRNTVGKERAAWDAFLGGYTDQRALAAADRAAIPLFVALRELVLMGVQTGGVANNWWDSWWLHVGYVEEKIGFLKAWEAEHIVPA